MVKHNNVIPNGHFHKNWERFVKTWFHQAPQKKARRIARKEKARKLFPRPAKGSIRPLVRPPTIKYNNRLRLGKGFTIEEIKTVGLNPRYARSVGISVDYRRRNKSEESLKLNVGRIHSYLSKLVVLPLKNTVPNKKKNEISRKSLRKFKRIKFGKIHPNYKDDKKQVEFRKITPTERRSAVWRIIKTGRKDERFIGKRKKRAEKLKLKKETTAKK
eukprot:TRINITY_DN2184_c0_g1_i2.p1 TRINITY_DN2184_c0_g1~~TRINITY_DN2184_c0_g1_i2.p1  ORF type:complete len:216 (+),score=100.98 TRINITY_DN2184_c0_g1_i2:176-823(+)